MKILTEMGKNPEETLKKYGDNPNFKELIKEWSELMGHHFHDIGEKKMKADEEERKKKQKEEEEKLKDDPAMKAINTDP